MDTSPVTNPTDGQAVAVPLPGSPGSDESVLVESLSPGTTYYFGLWSKDEEGNLSPSASASASTGS